MGLRLVLGALRLYVEAICMYACIIKLQSCPSNPAFECTIDPKYKELFARKESAIPSFGIRIYTNMIKSPSAVQISKSIKQTQSVDKVYYNTRV